MTSRAAAGDIVGVVRRRLLVNSWADPVEVAPRLPDGLRPHVGAGGGVVVGCCMIELETLRPWPLPERAGVGVRAAAHRISVDVGPVENPTRAVYVPMRHTDAALAILAGGRVFPGVHERASVDVRAGDDELRWVVEERRSVADGFGIRAAAEVGHSYEPASEIADIVIGTGLGLSPGRRGALEAVEMRMAHLDAVAVQLVDLDSAFLSGFRTAQPAETLLMSDVDVAWRRVPQPT